MLGALGIIVYTRLTQFSFVWDGRIPLERVTWRPLNMRDVPINILLFAPFGFALAGWLEQRSTPDQKLSPTGDTISQSRVYGQVMAISFSLSVALEAAQLFLPDRVPSATDVLANIIGATVGYGLYRAWKMGFGHALDRYATRRNLLAGLGIYFLGATLLTVSLYRSVRLDNWDTTFPLVIGNEALGKRQWSGWVRTVELSAGLPESPDYGVQYEFTGSAPFAEAHGRPAPALVWGEGPATTQDEAGVTVGSGEWLATEGAFSGFSEMARRFDAFVIRTTVASAAANQRGPARIVSISADADRRNITIGQERDALIVRLRTPTGGANGQKPELLVPGIFARSQPRDIEVSYAAPVLRVVVDGEAHALSLAPGAAFFSGFITQNRWGIVLSGDPHRYDWAYWGLLIGAALFIFAGPAAARRALSSRRLGRPPRRDPIAMSPGLERDGCVGLDNGRDQEIPSSRG